MNSTNNQRRGDIPVACTINGAKPTGRQECRPSMIIVISTMLLLGSPIFAQTAKKKKPPFPVVEHLLPPAPSSLIPQVEFPNSLEEQEKELASDSYMKRIDAARKAQAEDPHRPYYHFVNPEGRLNDPNGLCYWQGRWHLFYQAYPPEDDRQHWGHAVSDDLIHWRDLPIAIYPNPEDKCFSGSTLVEEDRVIAAYHGIGRGTMIAVSSDPLLLNCGKSHRGCCDQTQERSVS